MGILRVKRPAAIDQELQAIWLQHQSEINRRIDACEHAANQALAGTLDDDTLGAAQDDAHKLAGVLGMFGFTSESRLAAGIDEAFESGNDGQNARRIIDWVHCIRRGLGPGRGHWPEVF